VEVGIKSGNVIGVYVVIFVCAETALPRQPRTKKMLIDNLGAIAQVIRHQKVPQTILGHSGVGNIRLCNIAYVLMQDVNETTFETQRDHHIDKQPGGRFTPVSFNGSK
jgi:hypothetical protein